MKLAAVVVLGLGLVACSQQAPHGAQATQAGQKVAFDRCFDTGAAYSERRHVCERELGGEVWDESSPNVLVARFGECPAGFEIHPGFPNYCMLPTVVAQWRANTAPVTYAQPVPVSPARSDEARALNEMVEVQRGIRADAREAALRSDE